MIIKKKIALITGANKGIGFSISQNLIKYGIYIIGTSTTDDGVLKINKNLKKNGHGILINFLNIEKSIKKIKEIIKNFNKIDILIHNAGISKNQLLLKIKKEDLIKSMYINFFPAFYLSKLVLPKMILNRTGRIIMIGSIIGFIGNKGQTNYATTKYGLNGLIKSLALEVASRGITVNLIAPGYIKTDMLKENTIFNKIKKKIPVGYIGTPKDISNCVNFLISHKSSYITGQTIHVNGGIYMP